MKENELLQQIEEQKQKRIIECGNKLQELLNEYNCTLVPITVIINGQIEQRIEVRAN